MTGADLMTMYRAEGLAEGRAEGKAEGKTEGKTEGKAEDVLTILSVKFKVPEELNEEIMSQTDLEILDRWIVLAAQATSLEAFQDAK